ncbi:hypothetical protein B7P43_G14172 [Cryptotermes secundus]|uniref:Uncharacterized protein n=2 Tax=Cryptotermes secundus TaxID=105785 RepID=A0A2J7RPE1_9NEOP|nr:uncharacterized protein LOC111866443 isoform X2 [Cryptotermes secundus]XP_033608183.1 uncharacterized protein LOC111866443 isoform X2 [Cryptotermes secundus]XP_033608189.1 uncharacterized protein LOC111866443 isoform X2 [Cryptotermes secundus]PNF42703.1 hypothetical protein B7P43_G14172 [Cryptotermes secundus]
MRLWIAFLPVTLLCGFVEPGASTVDFGASTLEEVAGSMGALEKDADQVEAVDALDVEDEHRDVITNPPLTIHLPPLPPLPSFPPLQNPLFPLRDTVTATKTLYAEVTKRITRHPVCMTVYGVKPPCLPADLHIGHSVAGGPDCWKRNESPEEASLWEDDQQEGLYIEPTSVLRIPAATTGPTLPQGGEDTVELEPSREDRYLEFRRKTPEVPTTDSADNNGRLLHLRPQTHIATHTVWVTKVQKVTDYRVTATLEAKNCVPSDLKIPFCQRQPSQKPPIYVPTKPPHRPVNRPPYYPTTKPPHHVIVTPPPHSTIGQPPYVATNAEPGYKFTGPADRKDDNKETDGEKLVVSVQVDEEV